MNFSSQVWCDWYLPGKIGMKSLMGHPNTIVAWDNLVAGSGVFLYWRIADYTVSTSRAPPGPVLLVRILIMVLTPISALQLLGGKATEDSPWFTPHVCRKSCVELEFWSTIWGQFLWYAIGDKCMPWAVD